MSSSYLGLVFSVSSRKWSTVIECTIIVHTNITLCWCHEDECLRIRHFVCSEFSITLNLVDFLGYKSVKLVGTLNTNHLKTLSSFNESCFSILHLAMCTVDYLHPHALLRIIPANCLSVTHIDNIIVYVIQEVPTHMKQTFARNKA